MDIVIAYGVESMSQIPIGSDVGSFPDSLIDKHANILQGFPAEKIAEKWSLSRESQDEFALLSQPPAKIIARIVVGEDPIIMLTGVIPATKKVLEKAGLTIDDLDVIEINEAFASVIQTWEMEIKPDMKRVNPRGGAIALGHPLGASGTRLATTMLHTLEDKKGKYGLQVMCIGLGVATATIYERVGN